MSTRFLLASILLEPRRWEPGRPISIRVSDWTSRAQRAGFHGWELFENHYRKADPSEQDRLSLDHPIQFLNTYERFDDVRRPGLRELVDVARRLKVRGIKFNVGAERSDWPAERECIVRIAEELPPGTRLHCECHPGTSLELPERVREFCQPWKEWPFDLILHPFLLSPAQLMQWGSLPARYLRHAHVQMRATDNPNRFIGLSADPARTRSCLASLAAIRYAGSFSVEFSSPVGQPGENPEALFAAASGDLRILKELWLPLIRGGDGTARHLLRAQPG